MQHLDSHGNESDEEALPQVYPPHPSRTFQELTPEEQHWLEEVKARGLEALVEAAELVVERRTKAETPGDRVRQVLERLTERERYILVHLLGIEGAKRMTVKELEDDLDYGSVFVHFKINRTLRRMVFWLFVLE